MVLDFVVRECNKEQKNCNYDTCIAVYQHILQLLKSGVGEKLICKGIAVITEFLGTPRPFPAVDDIWIHERGLSYLSADLNSFLSKFEDDFSESGSQWASGKQVCRKACSAKVRMLYNWQGRSQVFTNVIDLVMEDEVNDALYSFLGLNKLHIDLIEGKEYSELKSSIYEPEDWFEQDMLGWTPLHYSAVLNAHFFTHHNSFLKFGDIADRKPLHYFVLNKKADRSAGIVYGYRNIGISVSDRDGMSALHWSMMDANSMALQHRLLDFEYTEMLRSNVVDNFGRSCLHIAIEYGIEKLSLMFLSLVGLAFRKIKDKQGMGILYYACISAVHKRSMMSVPQAVFQYDPFDVDEVDNRRSDLWKSLRWVALMRPDNIMDSTEQIVSDGSGHNVESQPIRTKPGHPTWENAIKVAEVLLDHGADAHFKHILFSPQSPLEEAENAARLSSDKRMVELLMAPRKPIAGRSPVTSGRGLDSGG